MCTARKGLRPMEAVNSLEHRALIGNLDGVDSGPIAAKRQNLFLRDVTYYYLLTKFHHNAFAVSSACDCEYLFGYCARKHRDREVYILLPIIIKKTRSLHANKALNKPNKATLQNCMNKIT